MYKHVSKVVKYITKARNSFEAMEWREAIAHSTIVLTCWLKVLEKMPSNGAVDTKMHLLEQLDRYREEAESILQNANDNLLEEIEIAKEEGLVVD